MGFIIFIFILLSSTKFIQPLDKNLCRCPNVKQVPYHIESNETDYEDAKQDAKIRPRIFNGLDLEKGQAQNLASIVMRVVDFTEHGSNLLELTPICSGVILNHLYVLTSATCCGIAHHSLNAINNGTKAQADLYVAAGLNKDLGAIYFNKNTMRKVLHMIKHDRYKFPYKENDIAIVELEKPFELGEKYNIYPSCLMDHWTGELNSHSARQLSLAGWGFTNKLVVPKRKFRSMNYTIDQMIESLKSLTNKTDFIAADTYTPKIVYIKQLPYCTPLVICGKNEYSSPCFGDEGGPLLMWLKDERTVHGKLVVVGILFQIEPRITEGAQQQLEHFCDKDNLNYYTRVDLEIEWIRENSGNDFCSLDD